MFRSSEAGLAVLTGSGEVVLHNPRAVDLGLVRGGLADPRARTACRQVAAGTSNGLLMEVDLSPLERRGREPAAVLGQVRGLGDGFTVVEATDSSDAVRLEATRRDFVANVSHELKTPVGAVGLLAEAVLDAADDPVEVRRFAGRILKESTRLGALVTELIALSRLTGAERLPELSAVDVDELVNESLARCRLSAESAGIEISVDRPSGLAVDGDRTLLITALSNLLENAIAYSPRGGVGLGLAPARRRHRRDRRDGPRHRDRAPAPDARVRAVLPRRPGPLPGDRRHRAGARHRQARAGQPRRPRAAVEQPGHRLDLHHVPARAHRRPRGCGRDHHRSRRTCMTRVLIVEDEESFAEPLEFLLRKEGFSTAIAATGQGALEEFDRNGADIVLLDLMLPGMSGTDVCKALRVRSAVPVIMVTARDSEIDKVVGLELGADDYVTKPYSARELIARIRAVLRRGGEATDGDATPGVLTAGPVRMDVERHVVSVDGAEVALPLKEFDLLEYLLRNVGRVLTRGQLIDRVWGADYVGDTKTLDVHVKRLRSKVEADPSVPRHLVTVRGLGYKFEA